MRSLNWVKLQAVENESEFQTQNPDLRIRGVRRISERKIDQYIVQLEVQWTSAHGNDRNLSIVTFLSRGGLGRLS